MRCRASIAILLAFAACSVSFQAAPYSVAPENLPTLGQLHPKTASVGAFTSTHPAQSEVGCRGTGHLKTPGGELYTDYIRGAVIAELRAASVYADTGGSVTLTANVDSIDASSWKGYWDIAMTMHSSNGRSLRETERFLFRYTPGTADADCDATAKAFTPAVQALLTKLFNDPEFATLMTPATG
jgi:hypothetical protein